MKKPFYKQKTTWTAIVGIVGAIGGVVTGTLPTYEAINIIFTALVGAFLRQGINQ